MADDLAQEMKADDRRTVIYLGSKPNEVDFESRRLVLRNLGECSIVDPAVRAVIVNWTTNLNDVGERAQLTKWLNKHAPANARRGVLTIIVTTPDQQAFAQHVVSHSCKDLEQVKVVTGASYPAIAEAIARYDCGAGPSSALHMSYEDGVPLDFDKEIECLLRRAFFDFDQIKLSRQIGGKSKIDGVWKIEAISSDKDLFSPFVVKCGPIRDIEEQIATYRDVVADRVPYRGCPPLCMDRSVKGATRQLAVSRFVENATRLDDVIKTRDAADELRSIYPRLLERWRVEPEFKSVQVFPEYIDVATQSGWLAWLNATYALAGVKVLSPTQIFSKLNGIAAVLQPICRAHDDLNMRNVFICDGSGEVVLIDFTRASQKPLAKDCTRLDVGFGFDKELQSAQAIPKDVLVDFYTGDLFSISLGHRLAGSIAEYRLRAIEAIRMHYLDEARKCAMELRQEYKIGVIAELLYHAGEQTPLGVLAYECASSLTDGLQ